MTTRFHKNHYESHRWPNQVNISARAPESLRSELFALSIALEEPMHPIILRVIEQYVNGHQEEVRDGMRHVHWSCRPDEWNERLGMNKRERLSST